MTAPEPFEARRTTLIDKGTYFVSAFLAMGCPCEVLIETPEREVAARIAGSTRDEAWRIEQLWSRYLTGSMIEQVNRDAGVTVGVDAETARLIEFCAELYELSHGAFDITSGVLREVWQFDGSDHLPEPEAVECALQRVGWPKVTWRNPDIRLRPGMQIDVGGAGKEYAVDLCCAKLHAAADVSCLVNFGGDIAVSRPPRRGSGWSIGLESTAETGHAREVIELRSGGLATSGDAHRFLSKDGRRYSHILDPRTGWPVVDAPRSVTVRAQTCTQAGTLATLASLEGADAEAFLAGEGVKSWVQR